MLGEPQTRPKLMVPTIGPSIGWELGPQKWVQTLRETVAKEKDLLLKKKTSGPICIKDLL